MPFFYLCLSLSMKCLSFMIPTTFHDTDLDGVALATIRSEYIYRLHTSQLRDLEALQTKHWSTPHDVKRSHKVKSDKAKVIRQLINKLNVAKSFQDISLMFEKPVTRS